MSSEEIKLALNEWAAKGLAVDDYFDKLHKTLMLDPESPLRSLVYGTFEKYTDCLGASIGDEDGWLEWFWLECDFGRNPMVVKFKDGEELRVASTADLFKVIDS